MRFFKHLKSIKDQAVIKYVQFSPFKSIAPRWFGHMKSFKSLFYDDPKDEFENASNKPSNFQGPC